MESSREAVVRIRAELKQLGITSRQVSVRRANCTNSSEIRVTIRDAAVDKSVVEKIAKSAENISRDCMTGEILLGGNTFVDVDYSAAAMQPFVDEILAAVPADAERGLVYEVRGFKIWRSDEPGEYWCACRVGTNHGFGDVHCWGREFCARQVAERSREYSVPVAVPRKVKFGESVRTVYPLDSSVTVLSAYRGSGVFATDGFDGTWFVVGYSGNDDLKLARAAGARWEVIMHRSRIDGDPAAAWRRDQQETVA